VTLRRQAVSEKISGAGERQIVMQGLHVLFAVDQRLHQVLRGIRTETALGLGISTGRRNLGRIQNQKFGAVLSAAGSPDGCGCGSGLGGEGTKETKSSCAQVFGPITPSAAVGSAGNTRR